MVPSGVMAIASGECATGMFVPGVFVAKVIGVTLLSTELHTYAIAPSGVMAILRGKNPTGIGVPWVPVARSMGVTVLSSTLHTYPNGTAVKAWVHMRHESSPVSHQRCVHLFRVRIGMCVIDCSF
jgi:hypothetical protein